MNTLLKVLFFLSAAGSVTGQNIAPKIMDFSWSDDNQILSISYDLEDEEEDSVLVKLFLSNDNGNTYPIQATNATGDVNTLVSPGTGKSISWDYTGLVASTGNYTFKLVADDKQSVDIQELVDGVVSNNLFDDLSFIEGVRHRNVGADHLAEVRNLVKNRMTASGLSWETQSFDFNGYTGENYVATIPGTESDTIYILCAHYDSVDDSPGADDNGSGLAGFLEAVRILAPYNFKKTIKLISFDLEEAGLKGSTDYVTNHINENSIAGVLDYEMIGYATEMPNTQEFPLGFNILYPAVFASVKADSFKGNFIANIGRANQDDWALVFAQAATTFVPDLKVVTFEAPENWQTITPDLGRSDHAPFWITDRPAVMLTGTANYRNQNYHTPNDTLGTLNFTFMANVVKASIATLAEAGEIQNSDWVTATIELTVGYNNIQSLGIKIFPNPVNNQLHIDAGNQHIRSLKIYDLQGRTALVKLDPPEVIDVSKLPKGIYNIVLKVASEHVQERIVIE